MLEIFLAIVTPTLSLFGVIVGAFIANHAAIEQIKAEDRRLRHKEKREAYSAFLNTYHRLLLTAAKSRLGDKAEITQEEMSESINFSSAYAVAALHAPAEIRKQLKELYGLATLCAEGKSHPKLAEKYAEVEELLYNDLLIV